MPTAAPSTTPFLRLNTETHTATINRIDVDAAESRLLTVSEDKTARLWSLPGARLIRVFRPPIGEGDEGKLYAGALSQDGRIVAVGGWTGKAWDDACSVYLFDAESGAMTGRLGGLSNVIDHLAFSRDGKRLAAGLGEANGIRVWAVPDGRELFADRDYGAAVYGLAFADDGRLAATSWDGFLRLYAPDLKPVWKRRGGGKRPYGIAFSPDCARLAVGYDDVKRVELWASAEGVPATPLDVTGGDEDNMSSVAWSADGRFLFAGGLWSKNGKKHIRRWAGGGNGPCEDLPLTADNTVMDLKPLGSSGLLFGAYDPAFGGLDATGRETLVRPPALVDMRNKVGEALSVSADGLRVRFGLGKDGERPVLFDLSARALTDAPTPAGDLSPARVEGPPVTAWRNDDAPKLADRPLVLRPFECSRSLAISPAGDRFVLGTEWWLRLFDSTGNQLWERAVPGAAWGVVVTGDGRMVVAAHGDGTLRWYRLSDGAELLALFVHPADRRWVVWTPGGHYLASPGAEELIGFHVNRGPDQAADFFPASTFRDRLNRPDVVARVLETLDEKKAIRAANRAAKISAPSAKAKIVSDFPPVVTILAPESGAEVDGSGLEVRWSIRTPGTAPIKSVHIRVDGVSAAWMTPGALEGGALINLPPADRRDREISVAVERDGGAWPSDTRTVRQLVVDNSLPVLRILAIGVGAYRDSRVNTLKFPAKDAADFVSVLKRQRGRCYREVVPTLLVEENATGLEIRKALNRFRKEMKAGDMAALFLAGHGADDECGSGREYYFLPHDVDVGEFQATGVSKDDIRRALRGLPGTALVFIDTCHAGDAARARAAPGGGIDRFANELISESGSHVFMACTGTQSAREHPNWNNGAFTKALVEGLSGEAAHDGEVTVLGLGDFVNRRVRKLTGDEQTPCYVPSANMPNHTIALVAP